MAPKKANSKTVRMVEPALPSLSLLNNRKKKHKPAAGLATAAATAASEYSDSKEQPTPGSENEKLPSETSGPEPVNEHLGENKEGDVPAAIEQSLERSEFADSTESPQRTPRPASVSPQELHVAAELPTDHVSMEKEFVEPPAEVDGGATLRADETEAQGADSTNLEQAAPNEDELPLVPDAAKTHSGFPTPSEQQLMVEGHPDGPIPAAASEKPGPGPLLVNVLNGTTNSTPVHSDESFLPRTAFQVPFRPGSSIEAATTNGYHTSSGASDTSGSFAGPRPVSSHLDVQQYLLNLSLTKDMADWCLQINNPSAPHFTTWCHSVLLWRSLRLRQLSSRQPRPVQYGNVLTLFPARNVMPHAFEAALRFLYSDQILNADNLFPPHLQSHAEARLHALEYCLSYWVAGVELGLEPIANRAEKLLTEHISWETLELAYKNAIDIATSPISTTSKYMTGTDYLVASQAIIRLLLGFLAKYINCGSFQLDTNSTSALIPARLPSSDVGRAGYNPALAGISFGSMPASADLSPTSPVSSTYIGRSSNYDTIASNILLNTDFENLLFFNTMLRARDSKGGDKVMHELVAERELRRLRVLSSRHIGNKVRMENSAAWNVVGVREWVEEGVVRCVRDGFLLPGKA